MTDRNNETQRWIGRPAPRSEARLRLFCFPCAGGGTAAFRSWTKHLPEEIELCLVQLPGRETRMAEAPYTAMDTLVRDLAEAMVPLLDRPYAVFGHSMGALTAFALTRQLRAGGFPQPDQFFVSGRRAPQLPESGALLHQLPDAAFVAALVRRYNGIPEAILQNGDLLRLFLPILRADLTIIETYRYTDEAPLDCPITAFGGWEDGRATQIHLSAWSDQTSSTFAMYMFPGGHFFIQQEVEPVLDLIVGSLTGSSADPARPNDSNHDRAAESIAFANPRSLG